ncbi:MAG: hypothetical protein JWM91_3020, partial [Rhodospirillales bacterium]|nr:hypothetical protein [Rhodospirillales bacterium]
KGYSINTSLIYIVAAIIGFAPRLVLGAEIYECLETYGNCTITAGSVTTLGDNADALHLIAFNGAVIANAGALSTSGTDSPGIYADGWISTAITASGPIATAGASGTGIYARSSTGPVAVIARTVSTSGDHSDGIAAVSLGGPVSVDSQSVIAGGSHSLGIIALGAGRTVVTSGSALASAAAIFAKSTSDTVSVQVFGSTTSTSMDAIDVIAAANATITVGNAAAVIGRANGITISSGVGSMLTMNGSLSAGTGYAVQANGAPNTINNSGTISGRVLLTSGNDTVNNVGFFVATGDSDFGSGNDAFNNGGTLHVLAGPYSGSVSFTGLERLDNTGLVNLRNGTGASALNIPGTFHGGSGSRLAVDAQLGGPGSMADRLTVGTATGSTAIIVTDVIPQTPGALNVRIPVVQSANPSPDAFTLASGPIDKGLLQYKLVVDAVAETYSLVSVAALAVYETPEIAQGAQDLWYKSADAWSDHLSERRDDYWAERAMEFTLDHALWGHVFGGKWTRGGSQNFTSFGQTQTANLTYDQNFVGFQGGYDMDMPLRDGVLIYGGTAGIGTSRLEFDATHDRTDYQAYNIGLYASFIDGPLFVNSLVKYDYYNLKSSSSLGQYNKDFDGDGVGALIESGYRLGGRKIYLEPVASIAWLRTNLDRFIVRGAQIDFGDSDSVKGTIGLRAGGAIYLSGAQTLTPYVDLHAVKEFKGKNTISFSTGGSGIAVGNLQPGVYGRVTAGVSAVSVGGVAGLSGFVQADGDFGSGIRGAGGRLGISFKW